MRSMFAGCSNLASLDVSKFDTSELVMASGMFRGCKNLKTIYCQDNRDVWVYADGGREIREGRASCGDVEGREDHFGNF